MKRYKPRASLQKFAERMEKKLQANDFKGEWEGEELDYLLHRLTEERRELTRAIQKNRLAPTSKSAEAVADEAADIANFCMTIAWKFV